MDLVRENGFFESLMRLRHEPELIARVRWYKAPEGALPLPVPHTFGTVVWETEDRLYPSSDLGEIGPPDFTNRSFEIRKGKPPVGACGQRTPTPLDWYRTGVPPGGLPATGGICGGGSALAADPRGVFPLDLFGPGGVLVGTTGRFPFFLRGSTGVKANPFGGFAAGGAVIGSAGAAVAPVGQFAGGAVQQGSAGALVSPTGGFATGGAVIGAAGVAVAPAGQFAGGAVQQGSAGLVAGPSGDFTKGHTWNGDAGITVDPTGDLSDVILSKYTVLGGNFAITAANDTPQLVAVGGIPLSLSLEAPGTYLVYVWGRARVALSSGTVAQIFARLKNATSGAFISNADVLCVQCRPPAANIPFDSPWAMLVEVTVTVWDTLLELWAQRSADGPWVTSQILSQVDGRTGMGWLKLKQG